MEARCPLCGRLVPDAAQCWCECGAPMDPNCFEAHRPWCAARGRERWIGALER